MPDDLKPVKPLLDDYRQALGLAFDIDDENAKAPVTTSAGPLMKLIF